MHWFVAAVILLPLLSLWRRDDLLYSPPWQTDPWFYAGYFHNLANFHSELFPHFYYGSRLGWILPGALLHGWLPDVVANAVLHLSTHIGASLGLFFILRYAAGARAAFVTTMLYAANPWLWTSTGWDHVDGGVIAYMLVAGALLVSAAAGPDRAWKHVAAGALIGAAVSCHLFQVPLAGLPVLGYVLLAWHWHGRSWPDSLLRSGVLAGAGLGAVIVALGLYNWRFVDGNFFFWTPSLHTAKNVVTNYIWSESFWEGRYLGRWLWFALLALAVAAVLLPRRLGRMRESVPALWFCFELVFAASWMGLLQLRGVELLTHYYYTGYLLPFAFLVLGASFWEGLEKWSRARFAVLCGVCAVALAALWFDPEMPWIQVYPAAQLWTLLAGVLLLGAALAMRAPWIAMAGLVVFTASSYTGFHGGIQFHGYRAEYQRVMAMRARIEKIRQGRPLLFWYKRVDGGGFLDYHALNATYMAEFARISDKFPEGCTTPPAPGTLVAMPYDGDSTPDAMEAGLRACLGNDGMFRPVLVDRISSRRGAVHYQVPIFRVETGSALKPLAVTWDGAGRGAMAVTSSAAAMPLDRFRPIPGTGMEMRSGELLLRTLPDRFAYALTYAPLTAPVSGKYRFVLRGRRGSGGLAFGAFPQDESHWLASDLRGHAEGDAQERSFWVDLKAGETVLLRVANQRESNGVSEFALTGLSAWVIEGGAR